MLKSFHTIVSRECEVYVTSLRSYDEPDEEYPVDIHDALSVMRQSVRNTLPDPTDDRQRILTAVIWRSLLGPSSKTYLTEDDGPFIVVEPKMTVDAVRQWAGLRAR